MELLRTIVMADATSLLPPSDRELMSRGDLADLLYADNTLLVSVEGPALQRFLAAVSEAGARYNLELHWGKLQLLRVRCDDCVTLLFLPLSPPPRRAHASTHVSLLRCTVSILAGGTYGFTQPSLWKYGVGQWLWDSGAATITNAWRNVSWAELELATILRVQHPDGRVPEEAAWPAGTSDHKTPMPVLHLSVLQPSAATARPGACQADNQRY